MMYAKTMLALSAVLAFGTASTALANTQFDANIYRPTAQNGALGAFAQQTTNRAYGRSRSRRSAGSTRRAGFRIS